MRWLVVIAIALAIPRLALAQDAGAGGQVYVDPSDILGAPEVTAAAMPSEVMIGTRFVLVITAAYDEGVTVNLPTRLDLGPAFEELRRTSTDRARSDGKKIREWQIECLAWELGELQIPPVQVTFVRAGTADAMLTNAVPMRITGTLGDMVDTAQPRGHAPPLPLWKRTWLWVIVAAVAFFLTCLVIGLILARRRRRTITVYVPVRTSGIFRRPRLGGPAEEALARLEAIDTSGMLARDRKVAYTEMIDVMQEFLGRQLGKDTAEMTLGELRAWLDELPDARLAGARKLELGRWLADCELVKFGGYPASVDEGKVQIAAGRELVIAIAMPLDAAAPRAEEPAPEEAPRA
jgi:hypothetical protein